MIRRLAVVLESVQEVDGGLGGVLFEELCARPARGNTVSALERLLHHVDLVLELKARLRQGGVGDQQEQRGQW